jgi:hypothetical protein
MMNIEENIISRSGSVVNHQLGAAGLKILTSELAEQQTRVRGEKFIGVVLPFLLPSLRGVPLCNSLFSVVRVFQNLTTENTELHRGTPQRNEVGQFLRTLR